MRPVSNGASIQEIWSNFKGFFGDGEKILALCIVLVAVTSFFLGRLSNSQNTAQNKAHAGAVLIPASEQTDREVTMTNITLPATSSPSTQETVLTQGAYVGSKNSTKYHLPWCPGAERIKEENKVWFKTKEDAEKAGYTPAANCNGI